MYAQLIDDTTKKTIVQASSLDVTQKMSMSKKAVEVGKLIAEKAKKSNIQDVVFDRNGFIYHGRVKALADSARENGLKF